MAHDTDSLAQLWLKSFLLTIFFLALFLSLTLASLGVFAYRQLLTFTTTAQTTPAELYATVKTGWQAQPQQTNNRKNLLLLGVDTLATRGGSQPLTDTMMLISLDLTTGAVQTLSLPRDLWSDEYQTKINALYSYGESFYPGAPEKFPTEVIQEFTGVPLHHTVVLSLDQVATLIDLVGGIEVDVPTGFTDTEFPRPDVDVTVERDPAKLYQTISFDQGLEHMSGERALQFIRSRHAEGDEGSDVARSQRQQLVIQALVSATVNSSVLLNPVTLGELYRFYQDNFAASLPIEDAVATVKTLLPVRNNITLTPHGLSIYPENEQGVIFHPPVTRQYQNQWVYAYRDQAALQQEVQQKLNL